jgi:hypothetical protein
MSDLLPEKFSRWSLERVQFVLNHLEDFIDDEEKELRERAKNFVASTDLAGVGSLSSLEPQHPALPVRVLERLSAFYDAGLLIQRGMTDDSSWWVTDLFWRGNTFHLELKDQIRASGFIPEITPMQVQRAPAAKLLPLLGLNWLSSSPEASGFLVKPTPTVGYLLISNLATLWLEDHLTLTHRLINKAFLY